MKRLTQKEADARIIIYNNIIDNLELTGSTQEEQRQAAIIRKQIDALANAFLRKRWKYEQGYKKSKDE